MNIHVLVIALIKDWFWKMIRLTFKACGNYFEDMPYKYNHLFESHATVIKLFTNIIL